MIDYPGKISCVLFTPGCNFTCPYCHNPELARNQLELLAPLEEAEVLDFLEKRRGLLDGVVITGGEPTLHKDLGAFCAKVKALGFPIKLDTNGSRPEALGDLLEASRIDYIAMDIKSDPARYAPHLSPTDVSQKLIASIRAILSSGLPHEFRTTCLSPFVDKTTVARMAEHIEGADLYVLQQFKGDRVLDPGFIENSAAPCSEKDLQRFQEIAAPFVKQCTVR